MSTNRDYSDAAIALMSDLTIEEHGDYRRHFCGKFTLTTASANKIMKSLRMSKRSEDVSKDSENLIRLAMRDYDDGYAGFTFEVIDEEYYRMKVYFIRYLFNSEYIVSPLVVDQVILDSIRMDKIHQLSEKKIFGDWHYRIEDAGDLHLAFAIGSCHRVPLFTQYPCLVNANSRKEDMEDMPIYTESNMMDALNFLTER